MNLSKISPAFLRQLHSVEFVPLAKVDYYPCRAILKDGSILDRAYIFKYKKGENFDYPPLVYPEEYWELEEKLARAISEEDRKKIRNAMEPFKSGNRSRDPKKKFTSIEAIAEISETPYRMPAEIALQIYRRFQPQGKLEWYRFNLLLKDGREFPCQASTLVDFLDLPPGLSYDQVRDFRPFDWNTPPNQIVREAPHSFCFYKSVFEDFLKYLDVSREWDISPNLLAQLTTVESADGFVRPCRARLKNGRTLDRVYLVPADYAIKQGLLFEIPGPDAIPIQDIEAVEESPNRLPAKFVKKMDQAGESGMGYCCFSLVLRDGSRINYLTSLWIDFLPLPNGVSFGDVIDLLPHEGRNRIDLGGLDYLWCYYTLPD